MHRILPAILLALFLSVSIAPLSYGSTITLTLNSSPVTGVDVWYETQLGGTTGGPFATNTAISVYSSDQGPIPFGEGAYKISYELQPVIGDTEYILVHFIIGGVVIGYKQDEVDGVPVGYLRESLFDDTTVEAVYEEKTFGPKIDKLRFKVVKSPDAELIQMQTCELDVLTDLIRTGDIEKLDGDGFIVTAAPGFHMGFIGLNIRPDQSYKDPAHGSPIAGPVLSDVNFRHALFHCYNQEEIVASIYKYIVTPVQSLVPPAQGGWVNPNVQKHPYNPGSPTATTEYNPVTKENADSCSILRYGGYTYDSGAGNWLTPYDLDGDTVLNDYIPDLKVFTPTYEVAPTSAEHGARFCSDCNAIGIPLIHDPREFSPYLDLVYGTEAASGGEFDLFMVFWSLGRFPDHIYDMCISTQDTVTNPGAYNAPGIHSDELDEAVETVKFSLDHDAKMAAAYHAQEMLYDDSYPDCAFSYMLLYSRIYFNAFKPGLKGIVNEPGYGSDNTWTFLNMHWVPGHPNERIEGGKTTIVWCLGEEPERLNPCYAHTVYAWEIIGSALDGLMTTNPYTLEDYPWIAESWRIDSFAGTVTLDSDWYMGYNDTTEERILYLATGGTYNIADGMTVTYNLRDDVYWQDGLQYTPGDAEFNLEFLRNNQIPRYTSTWESIVDVQVINATAFKVYSNSTSQFLIYDFAGSAALLPKPVWINLDGISLGDILKYDPATNTTNPGTAGPRFGTSDCPTQLYGTGPFVFDWYYPTPMYADMHANRHYFKPTIKIQAEKAEMFHACGDVDWNGEVGILDLSRQGRSYGYWCYEEDYDAQADVNQDCAVDMRDITMTSFFWGDKREYPEP